MAAALAGKMNIGEVEAVTLPDGGKAIVGNIPSNAVSYTHLMENLRSLA